MFQKLNTRVAFWTVVAIISIFCILIAPSYGITGDEEVQWQYGDYVWGYLKSGGEYKGMFTEEKYINSPLKYYGGFFDGIAAMIIDIFHVQDEFLVRHYFNTIFGLLTIVFGGLILQHMTLSWFWGIVGMLFVVLMPRFFGEMFNNPKDIPFAAGYTIAIYFILRFLSEFEKPKWTTVIGLALGVAISVGVRIGGVLVIVYFGLAYILTAWLQYKFNFQVLKTSMFRPFIAVGIGYLIACFWWPYAHGNIISNPLEALSVMSSYPLSIYMLFDGMRINTAELPSNYLIKWIWIGTPVFILLGLTIGFFYSVSEILKARAVSLLILLVALVFPVFYIIYKKSIVYDALRHIIFILPLMSVIACYGFYRLISGFDTNKNQFIVGGLLLILMIMPIKHMIANHPNQYVYFNEIFGGVKNAFGYYELDYYHNSGKKMVEWLNENIITRSKKQEKVLSNMGSVYLYYRNVDTNKVLSSYGRWRERDHLDWDYYIAYSRFIEPENLQNGAWPPANVIHTMKVDDVPVCVVIQRKNKADIEAYNALQSNNYALAASKYEENLQFDKSNEYIWYYYSIALINIGKSEEAVQALKTAIQLNSSNPEWIQQLQKYYQVYASSQH